QRLREAAERRAVLRRHIVEIAGSEEAAGTLHVLGNDGGIARHVAPEELREHATVDVVSAARRIADHDPQRLAFVEVRDLILCPRLRLLRDEKGESAEKRAQSSVPHVGQNPVCFLPRATLYREAGDIPLSRRLISVRTMRCGVDEAVAI